MKHATYDLAQMQMLPLDAKITMTKQRIKAWYEHFDGNVYISFSGGKDSTVLKHIVDEMYSDVPAVFVNTGLEYPEIQQFVRKIKNGEYDCFNSDVVMLRPEMRFDEVIKVYGYPVVSKAVSGALEDAKRNIPKGKETVRIKMLYGQYDNKRKDGKPTKYNYSKWNYLIDSPFKISNKCCDIMKKTPFKQYEKETGRFPFIGTMADESVQRKNAWLKTGCNAFDSKKPKSQPLSFWTEQDVFEYIKKYNVPYAEIYGDIVETGKTIQRIDGEHKQLKTTKADRTGCMFCMFGVHREKSPNRFEQMKITHPKQYDYCINNLGCGKVLDAMGVKY